MYDLGSNKRERKHVSCSTFPYQYNVCLIRSDLTHLILITYQIGIRAVRSRRNHGAEEARHRSSARATATGGEADVDDVDGATAGMG